MQKPGPRSLHLGTGWLAGWLKWFHHRAGAGLAAQRGRIFSFTLGNAAFGVLAGFVFGYASYLFLRYVLHLYAPPKGALKWRWHHHARYHYAQEGATFGVTTTLGDHVFGTMPRRRKQLRINHFNRMP